MSTQPAGVIPQLTLGQRLTVAMEYGGYKPETLAPHFRCSASTIRNYIAGRTRIDYAHMRLWAELTGVDAAWLESGQVGPTNGPGLTLAPDLNSDPDTSVSLFDLAA